MISDVIDRFRYRLQLWWRERPEDYAAPEQPIEPDYVSRFSKHPELVRDSTFVSIGRRISYFSFLGIVAFAGLVVGRVFPALRFAAGLGFVAVFCLLLLGVIPFEVALFRARKQYRANEAKKSSNQAMQRTAGRSAS